jgi:nucleotide-binding universal stress UspA family protein
MGKTRRESMFKSILVATDGSELGEKSVSAAIELARAHGSKVLVLTSSDPVMTGVGSGGFGSFDAAPIIARLDEDYAAHAKQILTKAEENLSAAGISARTLHVPRTRPADAIIDVAKQEGCDTIVMGSHGRRGIGRLLLGSQAAEVLSRADIAVLIVK